MSVRCPDFDYSKALGYTEVILHLTDPCHYDRYQKPDSGGEPLQIMTRVHVYFLGSVEAQSLKFTAHILIRMRWVDPRLNYTGIAPDVRHIVNEGFLRDHIWWPHVYMVNEQDSVVMGSQQKDVLVAVEPDGTVSLTHRIKVSLSCLMDLQKFPFDEQECPLILESWTYTTNELQLMWEPDSPVTVNDDLHLPEYRLVDMWYNSTVIPYSMIKLDSSDIAFDSPYYGRFAGNYSSLEVKFHLAREVGHYIMDYFVPSILLVVVSWVTFWLDPNAVPGRTTLGTSTMLTFITLTRNTGSSLPKVSYIKATEIWFIVCTGFIFGSLVEFAFVNTIWRRKKNVELKKVNSKYILKSTLTPQLARKAMSNNIGERCQSWPANVEKSEMGSSTDLFYLGNSSSNTLTVGSAESIRDQIRHRENNQDYTTISIAVPEQGSANNTRHRSPSISKGFTTMTPQEIATWIDRRSRLVFPLAFILFNVLYWGFVWI